MRVLVLLLALEALALARSTSASAGRVQAVEFSYYLYPRQNWERELVWLKNIGIRTVAFSIPEYSGSGNPRADLPALLGLLRHLNMRAWILQGHLPPDVSLYLEEHGGPVGPAPAGPITPLSAIAPNALAASRNALAASRGTLLWRDVEDALIPPGWEPPGAPLLRKGAVSLSGEEQFTAALRRSAALFRYWGAHLASFEDRQARRLRTVNGPLPPGVVGLQLLASGPHAVSAVSIVNESASRFRGALQVYDPASRRSMALPAIELPPAQALWLPINAPLPDGIFGNEDRLIYATAELENMEFENGILALEFAAPAPGEAVLQLSRQPRGPLLAGGHPTRFDWDEKTRRVRLPIPAGKGASHHVRIGVAIEAPESAAFFAEPVRLIIGHRNRVSTSYSSEKLAARSRLKLPGNFHALPIIKSPTEIDYEIDVPAGALHGERQDLEIQADGVTMARARMQLLRPVSIHLREAVALHIGANTHLPVEPVLVTFNPSAGRDLTLLVRNNFPQIQNYTLEAQGAGLNFLPQKREISIGAGMEREASLRVFADNLISGLHEFHVQLSGAAKLEFPIRFVAVPRAQAVAYSLDLDGDGVPEWILENEKLRAVFSGQDGGRWLEFVWKDSGVNVLSEAGALVGAGPVAVTMGNDGPQARLELAGKDWQREIVLDGAGTHLTILQNTPLPAETLQGGRRGDVVFRVSRPGLNQALYALEHAE